MAKIVVIGAGLTGLSTAYHLEKRGFTDYVLFEKEEEIGGLCKSIVQDGFTFDFTGHLLHVNNDYFKSLIHGVIGIEKFNQIVRKSFIYSHNVYTKYPFQINLYGLPIPIIAACIQGYVERKSSYIKPVTFVQWVQTHFGKGFAKYFFFPYQKKIFATNLSTITAEWTGRFVPNTSLEQIIAGALSDTAEEGIGYNASFLYPKQGGIFSWVKELALHINQPIMTGFCVKKIDLINKAVLFTNGHVEPFEQLITTMPLDTLLMTLQEGARSRLQQAHRHLRCNSVVNFNLGINRPDLSDKHWIYFPEKLFPFYRIGFPHNFSKQMAPNGHSSLYGEFAYINKSKPWIKQTLANARRTVKKLFKLDESAIVNEQVIHIPHAYVLYDTWREKNLKKLLSRLAEYQLFSVGRYGEWKYSSMQEAILDGKKIAENVSTIPARVDRTQETTSFAYQMPKNSETAPTI